MPQKLKEDKFVWVIKEGLRLYHRHPRRVKSLVMVFLGLIASIFVLISYISGLRSEGLIEYNYAKTLYYQDKYEEAKDKFREIVESYRFSKYAPLALYYEGNSHYNLQNFERAITCYEKFLKKFSTHKLAPLVAQSLGETFEQQKKFEEAILAYKRIIQKYSNSFNLNYAYLSIGRCYLHLEQFDKAKAFYQKVSQDSVWKEEADFGLKLIKKWRRKEMLEGG
jgi:TolA-binding protein